MLATQGNTLVQWRAVMTSMADGVIIFDLAGNVLDMNPAALRAHGLASVEDARRHLVDFASILELRGMDGQPVPTNDWPLARVLRGETLTGYEVQVRRLNRSDTHVYSYSGAPVRDEEGQTILGVLTLRDVTSQKRLERERGRLLAKLASANRHLRSEIAERQRAEAQIARLNKDLEFRVHQQSSQLRETAARYHAIFDLTFEFLGLLTPDGITLEVNHAALAFGGMQPSDVVGRPFWEARWWLANHETQEQVKAAIAQAAAGEFVRYTVDVLGADDRVATIDFLLKPVLNEAGQVVYLLPEGHDITELKRSEEERQRYVEQSHILHEVDRAILAERSPSQIAHAAVQRIRQLVSCERALVLLFEFSGRQSSIMAVDGDGDSEFQSGRVLPLEPSMVLAGHNAGSSGVVEDLAGCQDRSPLDDLLISEGLRSYASVPLMVGGEPIGALVLASVAPGDCLRTYVDVAHQIAASLSVAIHNARLFEEVRASREQLHSLSHRLVEAQEQERRSISRELHDEAGQLLTTLKVGLELLARNAKQPESVAARVHELQTVVDGVMESLHRLAMDLRPAALDRLGLVPALTQYIEAFRKTSGLEIDFTTVGFQNRRLTADVELTLYRMVQEALTNVVRHAHATRAGVILEGQADRVLAIVEDDGAGFDVREAVQRGRLGLFGMQERTELLNGRFTVETAPGAGTTVFAEIPLGGEE